MISRLLTAWFFMLAACLFACRKEAPKDSHHRYIVLSHTYQWGAPDNNRVDPRIAALDLSPYEQIWLGGDLCARTSEQSATLVYLDSLFHISQPNTHWAIGNHDLTSGNLQTILKQIKRPSFYTTQFNGIQLMVLNTSFNHPQLAGESTVYACDSLDAQFAMIRAVCDSLRSASHLVILHHHNLLTNQLAHYQLDLDTISHFYRPDLPIRCAPPGSFQTLLYPILQKVQEGGIQVILIGGDFGQRHKGFQFQTAEKIWFLGTGINNSMGKAYIPAWVTNLQPDSILIVDHWSKERKLSWRFEALGGD